MPNIPISKIIATTGGSALTGAAVWLNAEHVAAIEGWNSPLVLAGIIVTLCAASVPPFAERAAKSGQYLKAVVLWIFFALAVGFSLSTSIARSSGYTAAKIASAESGNKTAKLAEDAYDELKKSVAAECTKRGRECRKLEGKLEEARNALATTAPIRSADPESERLAAVLGIDESRVQLYVPLLLPLGLELGGYIFLAFGLAPVCRRKEEIEAVAIAAAPIAKAIETTETPTPAIAYATAKASAAGTKAYYLQRLRRDFPELAVKVASGEMSVHGASIAAGLRKVPAKGRTG